MKNKELKKWIREIGEAFEYLETHSLMEFVKKYDVHKYVVRKSDRELIEVFYADNLELIEDVSWEKEKEKERKT